MKKKSILLLVVLMIFVGCSSRESTSGTADSTVSPQDSVSPGTVPTETGMVDVTGDFDGDGVKETGTFNLAQEGSGMYSSIFIIRFSSSSVPAFRFETDTDERLLINEGDINGIPGDELTIYTRATTINAGFDLECYTFSNGAWCLLMDNISYPANLPERPKPDNLIFKKNGRVYVLKYSEDGSDGKETLATLYTTVTPVSLTEPFLDEEIVVQGDFDGDESKEPVRVVPLGDVDAATPTKYRIESSFSYSITSFEVASFRDGLEVFVEDNLDGEPGSELSVMTSNGTSDYTVITTYSYKEGGWKAILTGIRTRDILPSGLNREDLIFEKGGSVYYLDDESVVEFGSTGDKSKLKEIKTELNQ